ncbi:MAG: alpha-amylase family glycosyl hydrolase [Rikenellaceae bacterium]
MIHPEWSYSAVLYEMNVRQLTPEGTLSAAAEKLQFLKNIGITAIWLMPIYPIGEEARKGSLGSYYSIRDYCAVSDELGGMEQFEKFLQEAKKLGLRVILDWVANHTARDARWVSEQSEDWYERDVDGSPLVPWDWSDTAKLNYDNPAVWQAQVDSMKFWIDKGVDGFRCDMAMLVPIEFWQKVRRELIEVKPDIFMLAEAEGVEFFNSAFDCVYSWELHHLMCDVAAGRARANALRDYLYYQKESYPRSSMKMTFTSNHDENSWQGSHLARFGDSYAVMNVFAFLAPASMPLIYTGQEVGYDHSFEFFSRDTIAVDYIEGEDTKLFAALSQLKRELTSLRAAEQGGVWCTINNNAEDCLMILVRESAEDRVVAIMNLSPYTIRSQYDVGIYEGAYQDAFTRGTHYLDRYNDEHLSPWQYRVLIQHKE